jgi:hypothetical protein
MVFKYNKQILGCILLITLILSSIASAEAKIVEIKFKDSRLTESDAARSLDSLVKIQGKGGLCQDALYLMTHYGDREELFQKENQNAIENPMINQTWRFCSIFSAAGGDSMMMGRNWDNQNVGSIIVNLYKPTKGYSSISFSRAMDMGFPLNVDLEDIKTSPFGAKLLLAPFYATDGINQYGVTVATAGVRQVTVGPKPGKEQIFMLYLVRKILDQTKNITEAVELAEHYVPFDLDKNSLNTHLFVADASGASVILEYNQEDGWRKIYSDKPWQALTNKPVYNVSEEKLRDQCWRYKTISETLEKANGNIEWNAGMKILQDVSQKGTTWSVVYMPRTIKLYFSVYQKWGTIYHIKK